MLFLSSSLLGFVMAGDGLARWSGGLSSPMQPCRGRINEVNLQNKNDGGCFGDLRAFLQRIDINSLLHFHLAGYGRDTVANERRWNLCRISLHFREMSLASYCYCRIKQFGSNLARVVGHSWGLQARGFL
jgi:hypothetical protein